MSRTSTSNGLSSGIEAACSAEPSAVARAVLEIVAKQLDPARLRAVRVHVVMGEGGDEGHPLLGAGDSDVEAALAALDVERSEPVEQPAVGVLAVADREDDRVALVALDALEVLDEELLLSALVEEVARTPPAARGARPARPPRCGSACLMPIAITPRLLSGRLAACSRIRLTTVLTSAAALVSEPTSPGCMGNVDVADAVGTDDAGEGREAAVVDLAVREGDQAFVAGAVVPLKHPEVRCSAARASRMLSKLASTER